MENVRFYGNLAIWLSSASAGLAVVVLITSRLELFRTLASSVSAGVKSVTDIVNGPEDDSAIAVLQEMEMLQVSLMHFSFGKRLRVIWKLGRVFISLALMTVIGEENRSKPNPKISSKRKKLPAPRSEDQPE